ncbi:MAG: hypothetical protein ACKVJE_17285 [Pseudomonadales bacterium]
MSEELKPSLLQYRWYDDNPHTVTYGQWYEWQACDEHKYSEIEEYIKRGNKYELRKLYEIPEDYALVPVALSEKICLGVFDEVLTSEAIDDANKMLSILVR